ncbi:MAG: MiaB/RimO family radical SAM methylthiotransferase [Leptospiraceae bacterium]|nr:MiaB/RimO family radical SAM methylthiotransferase [Leptospiraceae bacterium]
MKNRKISISKPKFSDNKKSFYITTLGCPKNTADSRSMRESLIREGFFPADNPENSNFHLINSCTFIKGATKETIETILEAGEIKKKEKDQKLVVVGCFAERYPDEIKKEIPEVDYVFGTGQYDKAGLLLKEKFSKDLKVFTRFEDELFIRESESDAQTPHAFIKISDGCNRGCSFCIIPKLRGSFREVSLFEILEDCKKMLNKGAIELCLVSQDSVFYGKNTEILMDTIQKITDLDKLKLLRLLYLYPDKKTEKLLDLVIQNEKIAPYFESPIQHVSDKILKSMNRTGSYSFYKNLFLKARQKSGLEIRTSIILGFPGETTEDVDLVLKFIEEVKPEKLALFSFSPEEDTPAYNLPRNISGKEVSHRVNLVRDFHLEILKKIHQERIGKIFDAIVSEKEDENFLVRRFQDAPEIDEIVFVDKKDLKLGQIGKVRIDSFSEYDMEGTWIQ